MGLRGSPGLLHQLADVVAYWPLGVEDDALSIVGVMEVMGRETVRGQYDDEAEAARAELLIYADDTKGVASPALEEDVVVVDGVSWLVVSVVNTTAGVHRLALAWSAEVASGGGRG
jgi:hypothetical protein